MNLRDVDNVAMGDKLEYFAVLNRVARWDFPTRRPDLPHFLLEVLDSLFLVELLLDAQIVEEDGSRKVLN